MKKKRKERSAKWQRFEDLVGEIQRALAPLAKVDVHQFLPGRTSGVAREIDVLVRQKVGQYEMRIAIDCKDYKVRVDLKDVETFIGLVADVGANQGVMVAPMGFTAAALARAKAAGIAVYRPVSARKHDWQARVTFPALLDYRTIVNPAVQYSSTHPRMSMRVGDPANDYLFGADGKEQGSISSLFVTAWNHQKSPPPPGRLLVPLGRQPTYMRNAEGQLCDVDVGMLVEVTQELRLGNVPLAHVEGFLDQHTGELVTREFTTAPIGLEDFEKWVLIESEEKLAVKPILRLVGVQRMTRTR